MKLNIKLSTYMEGKKQDEPESIIQRKKKKKQDL